MQKNRLSDVSDPMEVDTVEKSSTSQVGGWTKKRLEIAERERQQRNASQESAKMSSMEDVSMEDAPSTDTSRKRKSADNNLSEQGEHRGTEDREDLECAWNQFINKTNFYYQIKGYDNKTAQKLAFKDLELRNQVLVKEQYLERKNRESRDSS